MSRGQTAKETEPVLSEDDRDLVAYIAQMSNELGAIASRLGLTNLAGALQHASEDAELVVAAHDLRNSRH